MTATPLLFDRLRQDCGQDWTDYVEHKFVKGMGDGTLPRASFEHYLKQDYLFLIQFARAHALALFKSANVADMRAQLAGLKAILDVEMDLHIGLCAEWGISAEELERLPEARATVAYTRFVLDAGQRGDLLDLAVTLSPCTIGYAEIGTALMANATGNNDTYRVWIETYGGADYQATAEATRKEIERLAGLSLTEARYPRLLELFRQATRLETDFWQMGLDLAD